MKLAISSLAFNNNYPNDFITVLKNNNINFIECVLTKIKDWDELNDKDVIEYKQYLIEQKIEPYSIQSLFYKVNVLDFKNVDKIVEHFQKIISYAKILGVKILVFGSPSLRKKYNGWENDVTSALIQIDNLLKETNIELSIEPNAFFYGGEFFCTISDIVNFIKANEFSKIKTMIDTHNLELESQSPTIEFLKYIDYINHIHVSEKSLKGIESKALHVEFSNVLKQSDYKGVITYEVINFDKIEDSIKLFANLYNV